MQSYSVKSTQDKPGLGQFFADNGNDFDKANQASAPVILRDRRDPFDYRSGVIRLQDHIFRKIRQTSDDNEKTELIKDYRFLTQYRKHEPQIFSNPHRHFFNTRMSQYNLTSPRAQSQQNIYIEKYLFHNALMDVANESVGQ